MFNISINKQLLLLQVVSCTILFVIWMFFGNHTPDELFRMIVYLIVFVVLSYSMLIQTNVTYKEVIKIIIWFTLSLLFMFTTGIYELLIPLAFGFVLMPDKVLYSLIVLMFLGLSGDFQLFLEQIVLVLFFFVVIRKIYRLKNIIGFVIGIVLLKVLLGATDITMIWTDIGLWKSALDISVITFLVYVLSQFLVGSMGYNGSRLVLYELLNPAHPLLKRLAYKAPGTYQHSINVGILSVEAGRAIGKADLLLLQAGSLVHDIGKMDSPEYFTENQSSKDDRYFEKNIDQSTNMIIKHVANGIRLAQKYRLPASVRDIITGHHGTSLTSFYYRKKNQKNEKPNDEKYRYPGPKPQSRESGIVMLADSVEAAARSTVSDLEGAEFREKALKLVSQIIEQKIQDDQLAECDLSTKELAVIKESFVHSLRYIYHKRVKLPNKE